MPDISESAGQLALRVAKKMQDMDAVGKNLGIQVIGVESGAARLSMTVRDDMIGGHNFCHGGFLFTLADTACAYACNSSNVNTMSQSLNIAFLSPASKGETLIAEANVVAVSGRSVYLDIKIVGHDNRDVAITRGQCRTLSGSVVNDEA